MYSGDPDLENKAKKAAERISENMHIVANEPSLAFYRLQEHVRKALPPMVERRADVRRLRAELQGRCYDVEYAVGAVRAMAGADAHLLRVQDALKNAIFLRQQLRYEESRRRRPGGERGRDRDAAASVYKRLSAHITLDLPDLAEMAGGVVRETTTRVENMMRSNTSTAAGQQQSQQQNQAQQQQQQRPTSELQRSHTTLH